MKKNINEVTVNMKLEDLILVMCTMQQKAKNSLKNYKAFKAEGMDSVADVFRRDALQEFRIYKNLHKVFKEF